MHPVYEEVTAGEELLELECPFLKSWVDLEQYGNRLNAIRKFIRSQVCKNRKGNKSKSNPKIEVSKNDIDSQNFYDSQKRQKNA